MAALHLFLISGFSLNIFTVLQGKINWAFYLVMLSISESSSEDNAGLSSCLRQSTLVHVFKEPILAILTSDKIVALQKYNLVVYTLSST